MKLRGELYEFKIEDFRLQIESEKIDLAVFQSEICKLKSAITLSVGQTAPYQKFQYHSNGS